MKNKTTNARAYRRQLKKVQLKLRGYINEFYSICYFDEKQLDWNVISQQEFERLKGKWKAYCKNQGYDDDIISAFHWDCMLLKTDLIMQAKHGAESEASDLLKLLKKGMTPMEVADHAINNLMTKKIV